ncbi:MAG: hypothetical protein ACOCV4_01200 [Myxococcota bacterium]
MLRIVARFLPLVGLLATAVPSTAHACEVVELTSRLVRSPARLDLTLDEPRAPSPDSPPAWCERADDPRCMPGSQPSAGPESGPLPKLTARARPAVGSGGMTDPRFPPHEGLGPRWGVRYRIERPPRG